MGSESTLKKVPPRFWNYPQPKQGPEVAYHNDAGSNPVLRGLPLAAATTLIASSTYVQSILWKLNKFDKLKELRELDGYEPRHDPTVVPIDASTITQELSAVDDPLRRRSDNSHYTCADYHDAYKSGRLTPIEVVEALLPLIRRDIQPVGKHSIAFLDSKVDLVKKAAESSALRYKQGKPLSIIDGVPIAVKDELEIADYRRTTGSKLDLTNPVNETAWCVKMLEEGGAIVLGKNNQHEMGLDTTNNNPNYGTPLNPHNPAYYTGGSSGGSAYTVAAGICPIAIGADGGGSVRLPASFCGVYGIKPTHGRVSGRPSRDLGSVGVYGPLAGSIEDLALAYRIMAKPDLSNGKSAMFPNSMEKVPIVAPSKEQQKCIGVCRDWVNRSEPVVLKMFEDAISFYSGQHGYEVVDIALPFLPQGQKAHALTILSEVRSGLTSAQIKQLTYHNQLLLTVAGSHATCQDFLAAQKLRDLLMRHLAWLWQRYPGMLILTPTTPCAGWRIGNPGDVKVGGWGVSDGDMSLKSMEFVYVANWTGCPAISCPMGFADGDVPVGLMAMGKWGSEEQLLAFGKEGDGMSTEGSARKPKREDSWVDVLDIASKHLMDNEIIVSRCIRMN